jgi:GDP-D-mannose dehydratase
MTGRALITGITGQDGSYLAEVAAHQLDLGEKLAKLAHPRFCWPPYGVAKAYGHFLTQNYRESYGMFAVSETRCRTSPPSPTCRCPGSRPS